MRCQSLGSFAFGKTVMTSSEELMIFSTLVNSPNSSSNCRLSCVNTISIPPLPSPCASSGEPYIKIMDRQRVRKCFMIVNSFFSSSLLRVNGLTLIQKKSLFMCLGSNFLVLVGISHLLVGLFLFLVSAHRNETHKPIFQLITQLILSQLLK